VSGAGGRIGLQGWLAATSQPSDDSLTVWPEWLDAPATVPDGTVIEAAFRATAFGDPSLRPDAAEVMVAVLLGLDASEADGRWADQNCDGRADGRDVQQFLNALLKP